MRRRKPSAKKCKKEYVRACFFCGRGEPDMLHAHRIVPGHKYIWTNIIPSCQACHLKVHDGRIVVHGRHPTSLGNWVIHYTQEGIEHWEREDRWRV